ncbi:PREDICTED: golgin subfamily A member 4-like [Dufourea novaeangliae]|uniref:golgin subfamily A member 4-like n=1 Tax=Dufourea novaeangliae TaxID=178035 RepID=UPI0007678FEF|nr:PREDICTED: golgin subfamily A member 4-like [Dufourea novaeangliae]
MWDTSGEPPGEQEGDSSDPAMQVEEKCERSQSQMESLEEIVLKNKPTSKKQEEVQEYARRLSKIKSRAKFSRRNKEANLPCKSTSHVSDATSPGTSDQTVDDISQAKTAKAKSTLLQKKLAEDRKVFEQRNKERTETKRAVEEKVEAIRQQLEENDVSHPDLALVSLQKDQLSVTPIKPVMITSEVMSPVQIESIRDKENKIAELSNKIVELEASIVDLQENLKEKDSVIESKTKAVTLMSADLSRKGKTTLDTLEDTKDEMRTMQEHFILLETSLKNKNENLLKQLAEKDNKIIELEESVNRFEQEVDKQKLSESASANFSRCTMDTLVETKEAMKSMQENFVLIESSLKAKNDNLLQQLQDYELKLAESNERIFKLESGIGIEKDPTVDDLRFKLEKLEYSNKQLQDEKYELQKSMADLQDKIVNTSIHGNGAVIEKDNRIVELENLIEELKQSNKLLEEESKVELQKQLADLTLKNEEYANKITDLENLVHNLEEQKSEIAARLPDESAVNEDEKVAKLTKELEELNKNMIKIKAQHKTKIKSLQKQLENFKMVSDTNAELVRLANQVALLEEEKGNLQLNLVDFDELKASAGDWQERTVYLESKVSDQLKEIQMQIEAIAALENQKLDLMQELHMVKQEISSLEAENAESENLRVSAEMKVVDFEEQLEAIHKLQNENKLESSLEANYAELIKRMEVLTQENSELYNRISKMEEKGASDTGSTESFEAIQELDKSDLLKKIEDLTQKNNELALKVSKIQEKEKLQAGSIESFESIHDTDKNELLKKIDQLTQENTDLTMKLSRIEEKGSSDTGSTESFERIPEQNESITKIDLLTQENSELVIKLTKLEEQLEHIRSSGMECKSDVDLQLKVDSLLEENSNQSAELSILKAQLTEITIQNTNFQKEIETLSAETLTLKLEDSSGKLKREIELTTQMDELVEEKTLLEKEIKELSNALEKSHKVTVEDVETNNLTLNVEELLKKNKQIFVRMSELEAFNEKLKENLKDVTREKEELCRKINDMLPEDPVNERLEILEKLEKLNKEKRQLHEQVETLLEKSTKDSSEMRLLDESVIASLQYEIEELKKVVVEQTSTIEEMQVKLINKEAELDELRKEIIEYQASEQKINSLEHELKEMQDKVEKSWSEKAAIEEEFNTLQKESSVLREVKKEKDAENILLKQQLQDTTASYESKIQEQLTIISEKENGITNLKEIIGEKDQELHAKYTELQNKMITIDSLQDELNTLKMLIQEKDVSLRSMSDEIANLNNALKTKGDVIYSLKKDIADLNEKLEESKPLQNYNELLEQLKDKDTILNEIQYRMNAITKENNNLLEKVKNLSEQNDNIQQGLTEKQGLVSHLMKVNEVLDAQIVEFKSDRDQAKRRIWEMQNIIDDNAKFVENLQTELRTAYKQIEQLKIKHTEDTELQNQRVEGLIEELHAKTQEYETLKSELLEKERLVGQNVTEEVKIALEARIADLEQKLKDSEDKIQMQLEKMKKIAANLKKKTAVCQELETRAAELEEKWTTEKDEKEAKNKQIQDAAISMCEKDNNIAELEEKLMQARNENEEALKNSDELMSKLTNSNEKMSLLTQHITEMEEEIVRVRAELESIVVELATEKVAKENIMSEYEAYKQQIATENECKLLELDDVKEKARELSVRMQVMESEYVEQLALIKDLHAANGLLLSKQTQINEKLENVEKESEERRVLLEQVQKEAVSTATVTTQTTEDEIIEDDTKMTGTQHCSHCEQCQTVVQALEAKLQEREAEIENLDNELANSVGNFVQMRESLRFNDLMNQTTMRNRSLEDPYNHLLFQYNTLISSNEEIKAKLDEALKENKDLVKKIEGLQSVNTTLEERIVVAEQMLEKNKQNTEKLENVDCLNSDLRKKCEEHELELLNVQRDMQDVQERADLLEQQLNSQTALLKSEVEQRMHTEKLLQDVKNNLEQEVESRKADKNIDQKIIEDLKIELETYKNQSVELTENSEIVKRGAPDLNFPIDERDNVPQLFDASKIFGASSASGSDILGGAEARRFQALLSEKNAQCSNLTQEISHLQNQLIEERSQMSQNYSQCIEELEVSRKDLHVAQANLERMEQLLTTKDGQIESLNTELRNLSSQMSAELEANSTKEAVEKLSLSRDQQNILLESYKLQIVNLEAELKNSTDTELIQDLETRISDITKERDLLQLQMNDLSRSLEELKGSTEIERSLRMEIEKMARERDEMKELAANLTRALEDAYKSVDKTPTLTDSSTKESTPLQEITVTQAEADTLKTVGEDVKEMITSDSWDVGSIEKFNVDEETWGWNADDAQLAGEPVTTALVPSMEMQLRAKVDDLQDQIRDLEKEQDKMTEENKALQLRSGKMIKKLKEYKVQVENLQKQLKIQKSAIDFYDLDSAIGEELKSQISKLEKTLNEVKEEQKSTIAEKEALMKRLDVLMSANERYMEMKERQDMDMEVLRIRNKELSDKVETLDKRLHESASGSEENNASRNETVVPDEETKSVVRRQERSVDGEDLETLCKKYKDDIDDIKDEMEALANENEQLQHFLEEQKNKLSAIESKRTADENESIQIVDDLNKKISELQGMLSKSREEYDLLRKQYEQSLMDANDQVSAMRQNSDFLKEETFEKITRLEMAIADLRQQAEASELNVNGLQKSLQEAVQEKADTEEKLVALTSSSEKQLSAVNASMAEVTELLNVRIQEVADLKQELQRQYIHHEEVKMKLQETIEQLSLELGEKKQQVEVLKKSMNDKENEFIQQQSVETVSALVSQATQELVQKHAIEIEEKEKEIRRLNEKKLHDDRQLVDVNNEHLQSEVSSLSTKLNYMKSRNKELQQTLVSLEERLTGTVSENERTFEQLSIENKEHVETIRQLQARLKEVEIPFGQAKDFISHAQDLEEKLENVRASLVEKEYALGQCIKQSAECNITLENTKAEANALRVELQRTDTLRNELLEKTDQINHLTAELEIARKALNEARRNLSEKMSLLETSNQMLNEKQMELDRLSLVQDHYQRRSSSSRTVDDLPVFRMSDDTQSLQRTIDTMQAELDKKQEEIEHFKYLLNENTYPSIIEEMQDRINSLYNEKAELESSLETATLRAGEKDKQIESLTQRIEMQTQEFTSKVEATLPSKERRSVHDQEEIVRLQNELHVKEQLINELKYVIAEKDSQLSLQASMEPQSDDFELRETLQRLTIELYAKEQEIQQLKSTVAELEQERSRLQAFERVSEETRDAIQRLNEEKEQVRLEAHEILERKLKEKEMEISDIKERLSIENRNILSELQLRDRDIENLRRQLNEFSTMEQGVKDSLHRKEEELVRVSADLAEKERRLAELSITKDTELHNLKVQIHEKEIRIEELLAMSDEEEKQLYELKIALEARETEINSLKALLEDKVKEYELIQNVLKKDIPIIDPSEVRDLEVSGEEGRASTSQELDFALYMLHQRDVRCEELTHELMQLLEERDTLQLRLSNAIRVNEDLRKGGTSQFSLKEEPSVSESTEPLVDCPSPSKSEGPVEIAKEAIDSPIGEDKETLAQKLSQLHTVSHSKDVRLRDERELRHTQQMSLLAHKDVLSTLPPEAAARLVNANYTLSRNVQSQSSVLLNWLWGKSTPKVVHM